MRDAISEKDRSRSPTQRNKNLLAAVSVPVLSNADTLPRNYQDQLLTEKRMGPEVAMIDSQNKAALHDMQLRFENQDRMINYLLQ